MDGITLLVEKGCKIIDRRVEKETGISIIDFLCDVAYNHSGETWNEIMSAVECEADLFIDFYNRDLKGESK